jgi:hypothetical protein
MRADVYSLRELSAVKCAIEEAMNMLRSQLSQSQVGRGLIEICGFTRLILNISTSGYYPNAVQVLPWILTQVRFVVFMSAY